MLKLIFIMMLVTACSKNEGEVTLDEPATTNPGITEPVQEVAKDIFLTASRDYNPSDWNNDQLTVSVGSDYVIPIELLVQSGNSATGWASLIIGPQKFCYQGNASNNSTANGTKFVLKKVKTNINVDCFNNSDNGNIIATVTIASGETVSLSVNGGGCSNNAGACIFTEVEAKILLNE
jgi:hypothetical protein